MNPFEKFSKKIGFTSTETNVILFILLACLIGITVNLFKNVKNDKTFLEFNYKQEDSLFNAASGDPGIGDSASNLEEKKIASQRELLDFTKEKFPERNTKNISLPQKIININEANISELTQLPGFGEKTAAAVIDYRKKHGRIKSLDGLLNIKGIGKKKLEKIKSLITLE
ncbi:MAG: ComEA family DNA-binding protein [Melioribacteraceae bacterium]